MKRPDIREIFFDLDGTLVDKKTNTVPETTQQALRALREKEIKLFIASGRPPLWAAHVKDQFDFVFDGKVLFNGQYCVDAQDRPFYTHPLTREQLEGLLAWSQSHPEINCNFMEPDYVYSNLTTDPYVSADDPRRSLSHPTYQVSPRVGPQHDQEILALVPGVRSARWNDSSTDLIPADGGKPVGMAKMLEHFDLTPSQCMAFGDGGNDIEMLEYAAIGVAMGNGSEAVKAAADYVTTDVDQEGIPNALKAFGLLP